MSSPEGVETQALADGFEAAMIRDLRWQIDQYGESGLITMSADDALLVISVLERATLPNPDAGCCCTSHSQDAGGGYVEHLLEYEPACPVHSEHLYDPRKGEWVLRTASAESEKAEGVWFHSLQAGGSRIDKGPGWSCSGCDWELSYKVPKAHASEAWSVAHTHGEPS